MIARLSHVVELQLWSLAGSIEIPIPCPIEKKIVIRLVTARNLQNIKTCMTLKVSQCRKSGSTLPLKRDCRGQQRLPPTRKHAVFVLTCQTGLIRAGARTQELGH